MLLFDRDGSATSDEITVLNVGSNHCVGACRYRGISVRCLLDIPLRGGIAVHDELSQRKGATEANVDCARASVVEERVGTRGWHGARRRCPESRKVCSTSVTSARNRVASMVSSPGPGVLVSC